MFVSEAPQFQVLMVITLKTHRNECGPGAAYDPGATFWSRMSSVTLMKLYFDHLQICMDSYFKRRGTTQFWITPNAQIVSVRLCLCVCFLICIFCGQRRPRLRQPVGAEEVARCFFWTSLKESKQINNDVKEPESFEDPDEAAKPDIFLQTTPAVGNLIYFGSSKYWSWLLKKTIGEEGLRLHKVEKCIPETWYFYLTPFKALVWLPRQRLIYF